MTKESQLIFCFVLSVALSACFKATIPLCLCFVVECEGNAEENI